MTKLIRRNQNKVLAILGVFLMIAFILPSTFKGNSGRVDIVRGNIGDLKLHASEFALARNEWDLLRQTPVRGLAEYQSVPITEILGRDASALITAKPDSFLLLQREALDTGARVSTDRLETIMHNMIDVPADADPDTTDRLRHAVNGLLLVESSFERAASTIKVSQPLREHAVAQTGQSMRVQLIDFRTADFLAKAPAPTTQQVQTLFDKYRTASAGTPPTPDNRFAFGYMFPNRVKLQYLAVNRADVRKAVEAAKSPYDREVDAYRYYDAHQAQFATTAPSTQAAPSFDLSASPASRPAGPTTKPYAEVKADILTRLAAEDADKLTDRIVNRITNALNADWTAYHAANPSTQPTTVPSGPATAFGAPYPSYEYLQKLAATVQKETGVLPQISSLADDYLDAKQLAALPGIGSATLSSTQNFSEANGFADYALELAEPFVPETYRSNSHVLSLLEPSPQFRDSSDNVYVFRLTAADPAHAPATLAEVRDKVEADARTSAAYDALLAVARQAADVARQSSLPAAAGQFNRPLTTTDAFHSGAAIENYPLTTAVAADLTRELFKDFTTPTPTTAPATAAPATSQPAGHKNVAVVELPQDGRVVVAALSDLKPDWPADGQYQFDLRVSRQLIASFMQPFARQWYDYSSIVKRLNYHPLDEQPAPLTPSTPAPPEPAPLM